MVNDSDPLFYEQLCIKHDQIVPDQKKESNRRQIDASMLEYLFEKPFEHWDNVSLQSFTRSLQNTETRKTLTMYLQSKPIKQEVRLIKEVMLESLKQQNLPEVHPLQPGENFRRNISLVSLLTEDSGAHDVQLAYYAKVIEQDDQKNMSESGESDMLHTESELNQSQTYAGLKASDEKEKERRHSTKNPFTHGSSLSLQIPSIYRNDSARALNNE